MNEQSIFVKFWKPEHARELLRGLGYLWDVQAAPDYEVIALAEQEGFVWDEAKSSWVPAGDEAEKGVRP